MAYKKFFKISLREDVKKQSSKEYAQFLLALMDIVRPLDQYISGNETYDTSKELIKNGLKIYWSDINLFKKFLWKKSREDLILISRVYNDLNIKVYMMQLRPKLQVKIENY